MRGPDHQPDHQEGSALIEAVVGIGLLAILVAGAVSTHRSATLAVGLAEARTVMVRAGERHLELAVGLQDRPDEELVAAAPDGRLDVAIARSAPGVATEHPVCVATDSGADPLVRVTVHDPSQPQARPTVLEGAAPRTRAPVVRVRVPSAAVPVTVGVPASVGQGLLVRDDGRGCTELHGLGPGEHRLTVHSPLGPLIDRTHVLLDDRPPTVRVLDRDVAVPLDVLPAALLTVTAATDGARTPDAVHPGSLGWSVRGDDARRVEPLGGERAVHPGAITVVVTACANPAAHASSQRVVLAPGERGVHPVRLATLAIDGVGDRHDTILELVRLEGCADGTGLRPSLRWIGGLSDGMRVALPAGVWEGRLLTSTGSRLTAAVRVEASGPLTTLVLP